MEQSHLVMVGGEGKMQLWGRCSSCLDLKIPPMKEPAGRIQQEARLRALFQLHFVRVHLHEDAVTLGEQTSEKEKSSS